MWGLALCLPSPEATTRVCPYPTKSQRSRIVKQVRAHGDLNSIYQYVCRDVAMTVKTDIRPMNEDDWGDAGELVILETRVEIYSPKMSPYSSPGLLPTKIELVSFDEDTMDVLSARVLTPPLIGYFVTCNRQDYSICAIGIKLIML